MSLQAIAVYVLLSRNIESLNISRNTFTEISTKELFSDAVLFNKSLKELAVYLCDLPKDICGRIGSLTQDDSEWVSNTELLLKVNGIVGRCRRDAQHESLNGAYNASESSRVIVLSQSDILAAWHRLLALKRESGQTVVDIQDPEQIMGLLLDSAEHCLSMHTDSSDSGLAQAVARAKEMIGDSSFSDKNYYDHIKEVLVHEIGDLHRQHSDFAADGHLLFRFYNSYSSVAYIHFMVELYMPHLSGMIKGAIEADAIAAAAQTKIEKKRRKDLIRARRRQLALAST